MNMLISKKKMLLINYNTNNIDIIEDKKILDIVNNM